MVTTNHKIRRLPGFRFETQTTMRENVLPRMDIAVFIGFASSGPIETPVVLESAEQFKTIFGEDLPLVWDKEKSETIFAYLAPTVRSFFKNGGKRCWIIRVARTVGEDGYKQNRVCANFFPLNGFIGFDFAKCMVPTLAEARSSGSWSDDLQIGTATLSRVVKLLEITDENKKKSVKIEISANETIEKGDLIRLLYKDAALLISVDEVLPEIKSDFDSNEQKGKRKINLISDKYLWIQDLPEIQKNKFGGNLSIDLWTRQQEIDGSDFYKSIHSQKSAKVTFLKTVSDSFGNKKNSVLLQFNDLSAENAPKIGTLLLTKYQKKVLCLKVKTVNIDESEAKDKIEALCDAVYLRKNHIKLSETPLTEKLTFEIWVKKSDSKLQKLSDLGFNEGQQRFWGNLPTDEEVFGFKEHATDKEISAWTQNADAEYFPLARNVWENLTYFPIFPNASPEEFLGAIPLIGTKLERDGLAKFDAELFLDKKLKNTNLYNLLTDAEYIRYVSENPRKLHGIHAVLAPETIVNKAVEGFDANRKYSSVSLEEATIISVPDAVHRGWFYEKDNTEILPPVPSPPPIRPEWWTFQCYDETKMQVVSEPLWQNFLKCGIRVIAKPENLRLKVETILGGQFTLLWDCHETDPETEFILEESTDRKFQFSQIIYQGKVEEFFISQRDAGIYYYRVKMKIKKEFSDWSDGFAVKIAAADSWRVRTAKEFKPKVLLAVQRALIRLAAARGDIFAVLDLPEHFDKKDSILHIAELKTTKGFTAETSGVEPFSNDELKALSFAAIYHPWILVRENGAERAQTNPPSGSICGVMAQRSLRRGAWIAPANEPLSGVLGLTQTFAREDFFDFQDNLINLVRNEPNGFLVLDSDTLSDETDLRSINVRRLLSLLRRLALKHGAEYVFEPNDERFRRLVQRGFRSLLDTMFLRGAFAGNTPAASYQVNVSNTLNNLQSVEQGRFIVEIKVAPSQPLKFVNVRLVQTGGRASVTETV